MRTTFVKLIVQDWKPSPIMATMRYAEFVFGEFYEFTGRYWVSEPDPANYGRRIDIEAVSRIKPMLAERLEYWIESLN